LISLMSNQYRIDPSRVYATGMSNVGFFTDRLACELSAKIAAAAVVAATMSPQISNSCNPQRPVPFLIIKGDQDPLVPVNGGNVTGPLGGNSGYVLSLNDTAKRWAQIDGCATTPTVTYLPDVANDGTQIVREQYGTCTQGTEVIVYLVQGGGHAWPRGLSYLPESVIGKTSRNMGASQVIWAFFASHSIQQSG